MKESGQIENPQEFYNFYNKMKDLINKETEITDLNMNSFEDWVSHGADDCHYMDLPDELIGRGKKEVDNYLNGGLVPYEAIECFQYIFNNLLDEGIIKD